jgi:hypothetical protein
VNFNPLTFIRLLQRISKHSWCWPLGQGVALGRGTIGPCASAPELVALGIVIAAKHSDLRGRCSARHRVGNAGVVGVRGLTLRLAVAGEVQREPCAGAGVDRTVIALSLGHESMETHASLPGSGLAMKEKALAGLNPWARNPAGTKRMMDCWGFLESL